MSNAYDDWLTLREAASELGVSEKQFRQLFDVERYENDPYSDWVITREELADLRQELAKDSGISTGAKQKQQSAE